MRIVLAVLLAATTVLGATIAEKTAGTATLAGYFPLYWDAKAGKLYLEVIRLDTDFLYVNSLPAGLGSNDIGLDRGQIGGSRIARFERVGPKVLLVVPNQEFRAVSANAAERRAVEDSFARSVLWGFDVQAEDGSRVLVDATNFYLRDAHNVVGALQRAKQGAYHLDASRSAFYLPNTRNFPKNTEVEVTLTYTGEPAGGFIRQVTPEPESVTVRQHHSFVELPGPGYEPRAFDPRSGALSVEYRDYGAPIGESLMKRFIQRHRIAKKDPSAAMSEPVKPIVYYVDPGAPEPIRTALAEGARWWNQAFEAAGYKDAFRVEILPEDADPMDIRYNLIQWVHRSTRGWSYGATIADPRTGEIIKGQVTLGSLRVRQDYLIAESLLAPYTNGAPHAPDPMLAMSLARLRQLSAHEVGHTLGFAHNFAASINNRASVMDYPHPLVKSNSAGLPDLGDAYAAGIGDWDKVTVAFSYQDYPLGTDVAKASDDLLRTAAKRGLLFITDRDARPEGGAHPLAHLWDNGADPVAELNRMMDVRARALARFGEDNIRSGQPMSSLEDVLVPLYLLHRYQTEAAAKVLGGSYYSYALRGDGQRVVAPVPIDEQGKALDALLRTVRADELTVPESIVKLIPPTAYGYTRTQEDFLTHTGVTFDPLGAAESAANITLGLLLNPERAARLITQQNLSLDEVIDRVIAATWKLPSVNPVQQTIDSVALFHLMSLASNAAAPEPVRAVAFSKLRSLRQYLESRPSKSPLAEFAAAQIRKFEQDPKEVIVPKPADPPPGMPIGCDWQQ